MSWDLVHGHAQGPVGRLASTVHRGRIGHRRLGAGACAWIATLGPLRGSFTGRNTCPRLPSADGLCAALFHFAALHGGHGLDAASDVGGFADQVQHHARALRGQYLGCMHRCGRHCFLWARPMGYWPKCLGLVRDQHVVRCGRVDCLGRQGGQDRKSRKSRKNSDTSLTSKGI